MPTFSKVRALLANVRCWVAWRIIPLSRRPGLMCTYTGDTKDALRHCPTRLSDKAINDMTKTLLNESLESCSKVGLNPFCTLNPPLDAGSAFWKKKYDEKAAKKARSKTKALKKNKKKSTASDMLNLDENDESEDDAETSQAGDEEQQQHESRCRTRTSGGGELSSGLPSTPAPRERRNEGTSHSSSGDSSQTQLPAFKTAPGGMAKPSKKAKNNKPVEDPNAHEPEKQAPVSEASVERP